MSWGTAILEMTSLMTVVNCHLLMTESLFCQNLESKCGFKEQ